MAENDDPVTGLDREALIAGADTIIEELSLGFPRFTLLFSEDNFPGAILHLKLLRPEGAGHTYKTDDGKEAWLCPALLLYFNKPLVLSLLG